ncbi:MAG: hypothetical protein RBR22_09770 [Desulfuromonas sp.]|nr:hypothetical protein [Desulfuromonas sp.]
MQITISFNPEVDHFDTVLKRLSGVYGEQVSKSTPTFNVTELVESQVLTDEPAIIVDAEQVAEQLPPAMKATLEIDVDGVPWDARIHSDAVEPKTQAGRWKKKRGVDAEEYDRITRELQLLASGKVGTDELPIPTLPTVQPELELPQIKTEETPLVEVAPDQFEVATLNTPPAPEGVIIPATHVDLMKWVATQLAAKSLETTDITEVIKAGNLNNLGELEHMGEEWIKWAFESLQVRLK